MASRIVVTLAAVLALAAGLPLRAEPIDGRARAASTPLDPSLAGARVASALKARLERRTGLANQAAITAFYARRDFRPWFTGDGEVSSRGRALLEALAQAGDTGLDPAVHRLPLSAGRLDAEGLADRDLDATRALIRYAAEASGGRTRPADLSADFDLSPTIIGAAEALERFAAAADPAVALAAFHPPHRGFADLARILATLRGERDRDDISEPERAALSRKILDVTANLERWRWLPRDLGEAAHVWVNVPAQEVEIIRAGVSVHRTRGIIGREDAPTPSFSHRMNHIVVNPTWFIPLSIVRREMLDHARIDGSYFTRRGIEVLRGRQVVDPATIDWNKTPFGRFSFRQPPGERNSLGRMKFMFPNRHAVYLHDTPARALFERDRRAFSSGCIRVKNPAELAGHLLTLGRPGETWTAARVEALYGGREATLRLPQPVPIHLVYFTLTVDADGGLVEHEDVYGHHARLMERLGVGGM